IGRNRPEDRHGLAFDLMQRLVEFRRLLLGYEDDRPGATARPFDQTDPLEEFGAVGQHRLEYLLERAINVAHEGCAVEQAFASLDDRAADEVGGEETYDGDQYESHDQPETGHRE